MKWAHENVQHLTGKEYRLEKIQGGTPFGHWLAHHLPEN